MVLRPSDHSADETPGLEADFAVAETSEEVPLDVRKMSRADFMRLVGAGAAALFVGSSAEAGDPVKLAANAKTTKGTSSVASKEGAKEQALNEWRRKHILKKPEMFKKEVEEETAFNGEIHSSRFSQTVEQAYYASLLKPDKYQREYPDAACGCDWGSNGKLETNSNVRYLIFRVNTVDPSAPKNANNSVDSKQKKEELSWMVISFNQNRTTQNNPDGIRTSMMLSADASQSVQRVEKVLKDANFIVPKEGLAKN